MVELEHVGDRALDFAAFKEKMPANEPRYAVYDLEFKTNDGRTEQKLIFAFYSPDTCHNTGDRFKYAQAKEVVKTKVTPVHRELQVNDYADLNEAEWIEEFN